ncbi:MAG: nucleotidyltransferase family protein [Myxococcaceae bacterium]
MSSLLDTFRVLSSFDPPKGVLKGASWDEFGSWALSNGVAPLAAYNLQYRLAGAGAPEEVRDRLLSIYSGTINDNVMKLVNWKRCIDELEGRKLVILSGAAFAEALYPHVAFRPVVEIELLLRGADVAGFAGFMKPNHFNEVDAAGRADHILSDTRTELYVHTSLFGGPTSPVDEEVMSRALPMKHYGTSVFRPSHEDAILSVAVSHARAGYQVPMLSFLDLRELIRSAPFVSGPYSKPYDADLVKRRAKQWNVERALYASMAIIARLFPELEPFAAKLLPELKGTSRALVDKLIVTPVASLQTRSMRGTDRLRKWLVPIHSA